MSKSLANTLNFEGVVPRACWADTCFENQLLYLLEINALTGLLTDIYKGWNFFVRYFYLQDDDNFAETFVTKFF